MRLRNIPGSQEAIDNSHYVVKDYKEKQGKWNTLFEKAQPIRIEVGMGKGKFLMTLAQLHPEINYIGIERYTSVLLRALQKMEENPLPNLLFVCMDAAELDEIFGEEVLYDKPNLEDILIYYTRGNK